MQPAKQVLQAGRFVRARNKRRGDADNDRAGHRIAHRTGEVHRVRAPQIHHAAQCRADNDRHFFCRAVKRNAALQQCRAHQRRQQCTHGRILKRLRHTGNRDRGVNNFAVQPAAEICRCQQQRNHALNHLTDRRHAPSIVAIGCMACRQGTQKLRAKMRQTDQAQTHRAVGDVVNLPAHREHQHLIGHHGGNVADPKARESGVCEQRSLHGNCVAEGTGRVQCARSRS